MYEVFKARGWTLASLTSCGLFGAGFVVLFVLDVVSVWQGVIFVPAWFYGLYMRVLRMSFQIELTPDALLWRGAGRGGSTPLNLLMSVRHEDRATISVIRTFESADGQRIFVTEGREYDRLLRSLDARGVKLELTT